MKKPLYVLASAAIAALGFFTSGSAKATDSPMNSNGDQQESLILTQAQNVDLGSTWHSSHSSHSSHRSHSSHYSSR